LQEAELLTKGLIKYYLDRHAFNTIKKIKSKLRRFVLCNFKQKYIKEQIKTRYGDCFQCGKCCNLLYRCPFLEGSEGYALCAIYHNGRPKQCKAFPIDYKDLKDVDYLCGYYFNDDLKTN